MSKRISDFLKGVAKDSKDLQLLKKNPAELQKKYNLTKEELRSLIGADLLVEKKPTNPFESFAGTTTYTFVTGMTMTASIDQLDKAQLIDVLKRVLTDDNYAKKVRSHLIRP